MAWNRISSTGKRRCQACVVLALLDFVCGFLSGFWLTAKSSTYKLFTFSVSWPTCSSICLIASAPEMSGRGKIHNRLTCTCCHTLQMDTEQACPRRSSRDKVQSLCLPFSLHLACTLAFALHPFPCWASSFPSNIWRGPTQVCVRLDCSQRLKIGRSRGLCRCLNFVTRTFGENFWTWNQTQSTSSTRSVWDT